MSSILLIEPDNILGQTYEEALKKAGHSVRRTRHVQSAVHEADEKAPDMVILELQMPGHSGVEFLYEFRSYPEWQNVPVLIHSLVPPRNLHLHATKLKDLGIAAYLYKPSTSLRKLVQSVAEVLQPA
jgi:DNA-binding response OmpR family regulator